MSTQEQKTNGEVPKRRARYKEKLDELAKETDEKITAFISPANEVLDQLRTANAAIVANAAKATLDLDAIETAKEEILAFKKKLFEGDKEKEEDPVAKDIEDSHERINDIYDRVIELDRELFGQPRRTKKITALEIATLDKNEFFEKNGEFFKIASEAKPGTSQKITALEDELVELKKSIEEEQNKSKAEREQNFADQLYSQQLDFDELKEEVQKFLPTAMAAGLSEAYKETKKHHKESEEKWRMWFTLSIVAMSLLASAFFIANLIWGSGNPFDIFINFLKLAPIEAPLVWFAYIASKRVKQEARLHEEHLHKWSVAFSFEGLIKAAKDIDGKGNELQSDVIRKFVNSYSKNPGFIIDVKGKDSPVEVIIDGAKDVAAAAKDIINPQSTEKITL